MVKFLLFPIILLLAFASNTLRAQSLDTLELLASAKVLSVDLKGNTWSRTEIEALLRDNSVSIEEVPSRGFKDLFFFKLIFPEFGVKIREIDSLNYMVHNPFAFEESAVYAFDLRNEGLYVLSPDRFTDLISFYNLLKHRTEHKGAKVYKKKNWEKLFIKGVPMETLRRIGKLYERV